MQVKIYVDILFFVNFIMNSLLLAFTSLLLRKKPRLFRLLLSALLGGIYAAAVFFIPLPFFFSFGAKVIVSAVMLLIAFPFRSIRAFCRSLCVFYLVTLSCGGICFTVFAFTKIGSRHGAVCSGGVWYFNLPAYTLFGTALALYFLLRVAFSAAKKASEKAACIRQVSIGFEEREITLPALYDTGNFLTDNRQNGILLAEWEAVSPLFPHQSTPTEAALSHPEYFTIVECSGIGGKSTLPAFSAHVRFSNEKNIFSRLVAITRQQFDPEKKYTLILPNDLEGAKQNDSTQIQTHFHSGKISIPALDRPFFRSGKR